MISQQKRIVISVDPIGNTKVEAQGFAGVGCEAATKAIENALAGQEGGVERVYKEEWAETETEQEYARW